MLLDTPGVTKSVFNERVSLVINGCKSTTDARPEAVLTETRENTHTDISLSDLCCSEM